MSRATHAAVLALAACGGGTAPARTAPRPTTCPITGASAAPVISSQADVDALTACHTLPGLTIRTAGLLDARHLDLTAVTGDLVIGPSVGLEQLTLPRLARVEGQLRVVGNGSLATLELPVLGAAGAIAIENNVELRVLRFPTLAWLGGDLRVTRAAALMMIDAPRLSEIRTAFVIEDAPTLSVIETPRLVRAGRVEITRTDLAADRLAELHALAP